MAFDSIWTIALGLHNASESVRINDSRGCEDYPGELVPLEEFDYHNDKMGCVLRRSMGNVDFAGITVSIICVHKLTISQCIQGHIAFNINGSRVDNNDYVLQQSRIAG